MRLKLKNVRQHKNREFTFPETGLIKIDGVSGIGKSTIFAAISEALFPSDRSNITSWDEKSSEIEFEFKGILIIRKKSPKSLKVTDLKTGTEYLDDAGEGVIANYFGMNKEEFLSASYIKQKMAGSLLSLARADQLRFIQKLAFGNENPEIQKEKIKTLIKERTIKLEVEERIFEEKNSQFGNQKNRLLELTNSKPDSTSEEKIKELEQCKNKKYFVIDKISMANRELKSIERQLSNPLYRLEKEIKSKQETATNIENTNNEKIRELHTALVSLGKPWETTGQQEYEEEINNLEKYKKYFEWQEKAQKLKDKITSEFTCNPDTTICKSLQLTLQQLQYSEFPEHIEIYNVELTKLHEMRQMELSLVCPKCKANLYLANKELHIGSSTEDTEKAIQQQENKVEELSKKSDEYRAIINKLHTYISSIRELETDKPSIEPTSVSGIDEVNEKLETLRNYYKEQIQKSSQLDNLHTKIKMLTDETLKHALMFQELLDKSQSSEYQALTPIEQLEASKLNILNEIESNQNIADSLSFASLELDKAKQKNLMYEKWKSQTSEVENSLNLTQLQITEQSKICQGCREKLGAAKRLKDLSDRAALTAVDSIINSINVNAQLYLETMFPNTGTSVSLKNTYLTQKGEEKSHLSVNIFHRGATISDISDLSGGEDSRICLAFQLALSDLYNSSILLIDEGFTGLDEATKQMCIEMLHSVGENKLVLVIEHSSQDSVFNEVVEL